jgi:hypothetical protein
VGCTGAGPPLAQPPTHCLLFHHHSLFRKGGVLLEGAAEGWGDGDPQPAQEAVEAAEPEGGGGRDDTGSGAGADGADEGGLGVRIGIDRKACLIN